VIASLGRKPCNATSAPRKADISVPSISSVTECSEQEKRGPALPRLERKRVGVADVCIVGRRCCPRPGRSDRRLQPVVPLNGLANGVRNCGVRNIEGFCHPCGRGKCCGSRERVRRDDVNGETFCNFGQSQEHIVVGWEDVSDLILTQPIHEGLKPANLMHVREYEVVGKSEGRVVRYRSASGKQIYLLAPSKSLAEFQPDLRGPWPD
jgi:hypothetical protein